MFAASHTILKGRYRLMDFFAETFLTELVPLLQTTLWCACLAAVPWVALELAGEASVWVRLAGTLGVGLSAAIPAVWGLRRIGRRARREYQKYAEYGDGA
jgi:hypothetical protein